MKKLLAVFVIMSALFMVGACSEPTVTTIPKDSGQRFNGINEDINIITDSKTGCKYLFIDDGAGYTHTVTLTPLMKDSTHVECDK